MVGKQGKNQNDLMLLNRSLILRLMHRMRVCSRSDLARASGLTKASVSDIVQHLIEMGVVWEVGVVSGQKNRRSIGVSIRQNSFYCIGVRLTRKSIQAGLFDIAGNPFTQTRRAIMTSAKPEDAMELIKDMIRELLGLTSGRAVLGIGLALPGPVIYDDGRIAYMSVFKGWENIGICDELSEAFQTPVMMEHDGVCFALSEWWGMDANQCKVMLCVLAGQGIGAGLIIDGQAMRGAFGASGELGHTSINPSGIRCDCGNYGCLEQYCSTLALERMAKERLLDMPGHPLYKSEPDAGLIMKLAREGDPVFVRLFKQCAKYLGYGIVNAINLINPDVVVVTDELAACETLLTEVLSETIAQRIPDRILRRIKLVVKQSGSVNAMRAASLLVVERFLSDPSGNLSYAEGSEGDSRLYPAAMELKHAGDEFGKLAKASGENVLE